MELIARVSFAPHIQPSKVQRRSPESGHRISRLDLAATSDGPERQVLGSERGIAALRCGHVRWQLAEIDFTGIAASRLFE
jgi:hypothetical protein